MIVFVAEVSRAQTQCPIVNCLDSISNSNTKDSLILTPGWTIVNWTILNGPGMINSAGTSITGLKPGMTTILRLDAVQGNTESISEKIITVAPVPPPAPVVISITGVTFVAGRLNISLSNGQTLAL